MIPGLTLQPCDIGNLSSFHHSQYLPFLSRPKMAFLVPTTMSTFQWERKELDRAIFIYQLCFSLVVWPLANDSTFFSLIGKCEKWYPPVKAVERNIHVKHLALHLTCSKCSVNDSYYGDYAIPLPSLKLAECLSP